jgi:competence protein ComEC
VVSAGKDNRYGHPHPEVVRRVEQSGAQVMGTADMGTIVFTSNGKSVRRFEGS